jgi:hypothetical protein
VSRRWVLAFGLLSAACERAPRGAAPSELRVTLPDGWKVTPGKSAMAAGPADRTVLFLESTRRPFPSLEALAAAAEANGAENLEKESSELFVGLSYFIGPQPAFLGVSRVGARTVWCSTAAGASPDEVRQAREVCRNLPTKGDAP